MAHDEDKRHREAFAWATGQGPTPKWVTDAERGTEWEDPADYPAGRQADADVHYLPGPTGWPPDPGPMPTPAEPVQRQHRGGWVRADVAALLNAGLAAPRPTIGRRTDGQCLVYTRREHVIVARSEAGKTFAACEIARQELEAGHAVLYLDFEDIAETVIGRMLAIGAYETAVADRFVYITPETPLTDPGSADQLRQVLGDTRPRLAILDGLTEAYGLHGLDPIDNADASRFRRTVLAPLLRAGAATLATDHPPKSWDDKHYGIGAVHKTNALTGVAYVLSSAAPIGYGRTGRSELVAAKDRPGQVRPHGQPVGDGLTHVADLVVESLHESYASAGFLPPSLSAASSALRPRPVRHMRGVSDMLAEHGDLSGRDIEARVTGGSRLIRQAITALADEGYVTVCDSKGRTRLHHLVTPFTDTD